MPDLTIDPAEHPGTPEYLDTLKERIARQRKLIEFFDEVMWDEGQPSEPREFDFPLDNSDV